MANLNVKKKGSNEKEMEDSISTSLKTSVSNMSTVSELASATGYKSDEVYRVLMKLRSSEHVRKAGEQWIWIPEISNEYLDWDGNLKRMDILYQLRVPTLLIGPKGTGKTKCIQEFASKMNKKLYTTNLSLRCRESHIIGRLDIKEKDGVQEVSWKKGPLPLAMMSGDISYFDELSAGEPDVLLRLDETLDARRQLNFEGEEIIAHSEWWPVSSINPLTTPGTKPLPPQLLSRFTGRLEFKYPDTPTELKIVKAHVNVNGHKDDMIRVINFFQEMRASDELPYTPSIRESIVMGKLLEGGMELHEALDMIAFNVYSHWDDESGDVARQLADSLGLSA